MGRRLMFRVKVKSLLIPRSHESGDRIQIERIETSCAKAVGGNGQHGGVVSTPGAIGQQQAGPARFGHPTKRRPERPVRGHASTDT